MSSQIVARSTSKSPENVIAILCKRVWCTNYWI